MFSHTQYIPILRFKQSEKLALLHLEMEDRCRITPLFELSPNIIEPKKTKDKITKQIIERKISYEEVFPGIIKQIQSFWGKLPFFIDFELLERLLVYPSGSHPAKMVCDAAIEEKMPMVMVTGLNRSTQYDFIVRQYTQKTKKGICLRLTANDLKDSSLNSKISSILSSFDLSYSYVDLIIDLKLIHQNELNLREIIEVLPKINSWRTFTIINGAFPRDLSDFEKNQQHEIVRSDWEYWIRQIQQSGISRIPSFGDYTIQHPIYYDPVPGANPSASIRYTAKDYWLIMRGEALKGDNSPGFSQYWGQASLLYNHQDYCGKDFSYGDEYISIIGNQYQETGNPRTWLTAGINHHLVYTTKQIARTFGISNTVAPKDGWSLGPRPQQGVGKGRSASLSGSPQPSLFPQGG